MNGLTLSQLDELSTIIEGECVESIARPEAVTTFIRLSIDIDLDGPLLAIGFDAAKAKVEARMAELAREWFDEAGYYDDAPARFAPYIEDEVQQRRWRHEDPDGENDRADYMRDLMGGR